MKNRIAILCPGLGRVNRGYEQFARELFNTMQKTIDIILFKGAGTKESREVIIGGLHRDGSISIGLEHIWKDRFFWEIISFGFLVWPKIMRSSFQLVHYSEPTLNSLFFRFERWLGGGPRRLFSHALNMEPEHCLRCHHLHQVSLEAYEHALEIGVPRNRMTLLPYGIDTSRFKPSSSSARIEFRRKYSIPHDSVVVLCAAALNRRHKRIDCLVRAMANLKGNYHLVLCGKIEDRSILDESRILLGEHFTHLYIKSENMNEIYSLADLFVLPSLVEGFGLVVLEAALSGLPVLVHDSPHFRWMLGPKWNYFVDMADPEAMTHAIAECLDNCEHLARKMRLLRGEMIERYDWSNLQHAYMRMYQQVLEGPSITISREMGLSV